MILRNTLILLISLLSLVSFSQDFKKENRIYMLDITKSMWGLAGTQFNIFENVKEALYKGIKDIEDPQTIVTVIPFQATHTYTELKSWTFKAGDISSFNNMKNDIDSYSLKTVPGGHTDVYSALEMAKKKIDKERINYIFMLTDGEQSPVPSSPTKIYRVDFSEKDLKNSLNNWCEYSKTKDVYLFYVMLTKAAFNEELVEIINSQCNAFITEGTDINIAFIKPSSNQVKINLNDNPEKIEIPFGANNWSYIKPGTKVNLKLKENDLFELKDNKVDLNNNKIIINLKRKNNISFENLIKRSPEGNISLPLIISTDNDLIILNPNININVNNKKERILNLEFIN